MLPANTPPNGWKRRHVADLFDIRASGDIDWARWSSEQDALHPYPVFANGRADSGLHGYASYSVEKGDAITLTARGTLGELGFAFFRSKAFTPIGRLLVLRSKGEADARFFTNYINGRVRFAQENTGVAQLTAPQVARYQVDLPPLAEQRAIATALSDVDALIAGLERLIAKKRDIKQAAMQQLLTGQTRLPGFSGEWEEKRLGDIGEISSAGVDKKIRPDEVSVRLVNFLDVYRRDFIFSRDLDHWVTAPVQQARRCAVQKGDVFFTPTSETRDDIGLSAVAMEDIPDAAYSYHVVRLRLHESWDLRFRTYVFKTRAFLDQAETLCDGNGTRYVISQGKFRSMTVKVPPLAEQAAIATVLYDIDADLTALESRLAKTRAIKQGMMQELLTGRIRLLETK